MCLQLPTEGLSEAHVIPKAIGGRLAVDFLRKQCNERLGYSVEAKPKSDPRLVLAIDALKGDVPDLALPFRSGACLRSTGTSSVVDRERARLPG